MYSARGRMMKSAREKKGKFRMLDLGFFFVIFVLGIVLLIAGINSINSVEAKEIEMPYYFKLSVDSTKHNDYGFTYPVTYQFSILSGSLGLRAYKKYTESGSWTEITEKTSDNFFNGIEAVRFDYQSDKAYVSVVFSDISDEIFLKIIDQLQNPVAAYDGIPKYYDNRDAAVVFSADDWCGDSSVSWADPTWIDSKFQEACDMFTSKKIWLSVGILTQGYSNDPIWGKTLSPDWSHIQGKIDAGYIEAIAHSRTHPRNVPYDDYDSEIGGSKQDIIDNLNLPSLYKKGAYEYIWGFTSPHSKFDETMYSKLGQYKYLTVLAGFPYDPKFYQDGSFPPWNAEHGLYDKWNRWGYLELETLSELNYQFDERTGAGKIYHIGFHPWDFPDFSSGSKIDQHTDYVKDKKNLWYVGYGVLMMYHYVQDQKVVTVENIWEPEGFAELSEVFSSPNPCYPARGQVVRIVGLPQNTQRIDIYNIAGELVRSFEKGEFNFTLVWDCKNNSGQGVAGGIYIYLVITAEGERKTGKIAIIK